MYIHENCFHPQRDILIILLEHTAGMRIGKCWSAKTKLCTTVVDLLHRFHEKKSLVVSYLTFKKKDGITVLDTDGPKLT